MKSGTIRAVTEELRQRGYCVSESWIRERIRAGDIPAMKSGNRSIVSFRVVKDYIDDQLTGGTNGRKD